MQNLSDAEREIASMHVWSRGRAGSGNADAVAKKYKIKPNSKSYSYYQSGTCLGHFLEYYAGDNSALWLLFPGRYGRKEIFFKEILKIIKEMPRTYQRATFLTDCYSRENRRTDFANTVRFYNTNKPTATKTGSVGKPVALKLRNFCGYEDFAEGFNEAPEDMRTTDGMLVTFPLTILCLSGGLVSVENKRLVPHAQAAELLKLPYEKLIRKLFDAYIYNNDFDEISIIKGIKAQYGHRPANARVNIANELKMCPVGQPVSAAEFERNLNIARYDFARPNMDNVMGSSSSYYEAGWFWYEHKLIQIILTFFYTLGIIDIEWGGESVQYEDYVRRVPRTFVINPLGEYVLRMTDTYAPTNPPEQKDSAGFTVLPDYTVVIPESNDRITHELYFEGLFTKISSTDEAAVYRLDFDTIVRALDKGESIEKIKKYLAESDKPLPENVTRTLSDWAEQAGRIKIRQVTVLECDDNTLLEEVIRYKGMGEYVKERITGAVVDDEAVHVIKRTIEKNKRFCVNAV